MSNKAKPIIAGVVVLVLIAAVGIWYVALRPTADKPADLSAAGGQGDTGPERKSADGSWKLQAGPNVFVGYRVNETFAAGNLKKTANGRTPAVTGTMTVAGNSVSAAEFTADLTKLQSDEARRDSQLAGRGIQTEQFPTATFKTTQPITLPSAPKNGEEISVTAKGELTLHGKTKAVDVPLKAKWTNSTITVATVGEGFPIAFADYGIEPISIANFVSTEDRGTIELQFTFVPV